MIRQNTFRLILILIISIVCFNNTINFTNSINLSNTHNQSVEAKINNFQITGLEPFKNAKINYQRVRKPAELHAISSINADFPSSEFISTWDTNKISFGSSNTTQITLPLESNGIYNFTVSWGDGTSNLVTRYNQTIVTHTYHSQGIYTLNITGTIIGWRFNNAGDVLKLTQISNWGPLRLGNNGYYFYGAQNLVLKTNDSLDLNGTANLEGTFENCYSLGNSGNLNSWNVSQITNMANMFYGANNFNQSLASWDIHNVTNMSRIFENAYRFNHAIDSWNVAHVTDMSYMFKYAVSFNEPIGLWNVSQVTDMSGMFAEANKYNQPIDSWDVSHVTNMTFMFAGASNFNQPLNLWDVSHVTNMSNMFSATNNFNQTINSWNVSKVTDMYGMFSGAIIFNQRLDSWNVARVTDMYAMFSAAYKFNQPLNAWNVSNVTNMAYMFALATSFDQPLNSWNVFQVNDLEATFYAASHFNQPIGSWNISQVSNMAHMFANISLSISNYDQLLLGWSSLQNVIHNVNFDAGNSQYSSSASNARQRLINKFGWIITDKGLASSEALFNSIIITIVAVTFGVGVIGIFIIISISFVEYKKNMINRNSMDLKFRTYLKNIFKLRKDKATQKETLSIETLDKIKQIIDENKEK